jgi:hypothetical protein
MAKNQKRGADRPTSTQGRLDGSGSGSRLATYALGGIVSLVLVAFAAAAFASSNQPGEEVESLGNEHIASVNAPHEPYNTDPPTSGPHVDSLAPWGVSEEPIPDELQVHNLEDGGVAIQYGSGVQEGDVETLASIVRDYDRVILAPRPNLPEKKIALTAWGRILELEDLDEEQIRDFIEAYEGIDHHGAG